MSWFQSNLLPNHTRIHLIPCWVVLKEQFTKIILSWPTQPLVVVARIVMSNASQQTGTFVIIIDPALIVWQVITVFLNFLSIGLCLWMLCGLVKTKNTSSVKRALTLSWLTSILSWSRQRQLRLFTVTSCLLAMVNHLVHYASDMANVYGADCVSWKKKPPQRPLFFYLLYPPLGTFLPTRYIYCISTRRPLHSLHSLVRLPWTPHTTRKIFQNRNYHPWNHQASYSCSISIFCWFSLHHYYCLNTYSRFWDIGHSNR